MPEMPDLRSLERDSIRAFVESCSEHLTGRVLDYGCGRQPYRSIIEAAGGEYLPFDRAHFPANLSGEDVGLATWAWAGFDAVLCTQVLQYCHYPTDELMRFRQALRDGGHLVLTYPTNWPEVEEADLHRFTKAGMEHMLDRRGFTVIRHDWRHGFQHEGNSFTCGYGCVAQAI
jgi:SAM-dependent methyltransferase